MSRYTIDLRPESINGEAWCSVLVSDTDTGARVYSDKQDLSQAHIRAKLIAKLAERKYTDEPVETLEKKILDAIANFEAQIAEADAACEPPPRCSLRSLIDAYPRLHDPIIEGLLRALETLNIISLTKIGKSWLLYGLLLSIATGSKWLDRFPTRKGRVLLIDNELHEPTIANRLRSVAEALELPFDECLDNVDIWPIRGFGLDIQSIFKHLQKSPPQKPYFLIAVDAKYRAIPAVVSENDNAAETRFYNTVDMMADNLGCAVALIHHSTKGSQSDKRVTDVGSGAGAQSRAADTHLVFREHEEPDAVVLDAAVRSFAPIEPIALRWRFPLWVPDSYLDPERLKGKQSRQANMDAETYDAIKRCCSDWRTRGEIEAATAFGAGRTNRGIARLLAKDELESGRQDRPRNPDSEVFRVKK